MPETAPTAKRMANAFGPATGEGQIDRVAGPQPEPLGDEQQERQPHAEHGEDDVEGERGAHLGASGEKIGQSALPTRMFAKAPPAPGSRRVKDTGPITRRRQRRCWTPSKRPESAMAYSWVAEPVPNPAS